MPVNDKSNLASVRISHNIDRGIRIVDKTEILISFRNGCIHRRLHIADNHRMAGALRDFQLRTEHRQIQGRRNLADSPSVSLHHASHLVGGRRRISVFRGKRNDNLLHGKLLAGIENRTVYQLRPPFYILLAVGIAAGIIGAAASQRIMHQRQLLRISLRLIHVSYENHVAVAAMPLVRHIIHQFFHRRVRVDHIAILAFMDDETSILQGQRRVHSRRIHGSRLVFNHTADRRLIYGKLKFQNFRSRLLQITLYLKTIQDISSLPRIQRLADYIHICTGKPEFSRCGLHRLTAGIESNRTVLQLFHSCIDRLRDLFLIHSADTDIFNVNPLQRCLRHSGLYDIRSGEHGKKADCQSSTALNPFFSHWQYSFPVHRYLMQNLSIDVLN